MDNDVVQGAEDQAMQEEGGGKAPWMMDALIKLLGNICSLRVPRTSESVQRDLCPVCL